MTGKIKPLVAVVGAGPAGLYAARQLAKDDYEVALFNRDIKPGGLAEYGIYYDKYRMKEGLRRQFRLILDLPCIHYYGNLTVGRQGDLSLEELQSLGFRAILVTVGAQGTKWLGLPGEQSRGVYHAKDLVYHYNQLPPFSQQEFAIGQRVALIGAGNVMMDIAHWVIRDLKVKEVVVVVRRGPAEVKFTRKEMEYIAANLDTTAVDDEIARVAPVMQALGQDVAAAKGFILACLPKALEPVSDTRFYFDFLASPTQILGDAAGRVYGLEVEETTLTGDPANPKARGTGVRRILDVDTVVFCIGDKVDENFGLPVRWNEFVKNPAARFPVDEMSYEAYDPDTEKPIEGIFVAGWSREASSGLVGVARKDGENGAQAVNAYLQSLDGRVPAEDILIRLEQRLAALNKAIVTKEDVQKLESAEQIEAEKRGLEVFKFASNEAMLAAIGKLLPR